MENDVRPDTRASAQVMWVAISIVRGGVQILQTVQEEHQSFACLGLQPLLNDAGQLVIDLFLQGCAEGVAPTIARTYQLKDLPNQLIQHHTNLAVCSGHSRKAVWGDSEKALPKSADFPPRNTLARSADLPPPGAEVTISGKFSPAVSDKM
eukprot:3935726-Rhodomonas_salina.4